VNCGSLVRARSSSTAASRHRPVAVLLRDKVAELALFFYRSFDSIFTLE
jgi:hypothetical protein